MEFGGAQISGDELQALLRLLTTPAVPSAPPLIPHAQTLAFLRSQQDEMRANLLSSLLQQPVSTNTVAVMPFAIDPITVNAVAALSFAIDTNATNALLPLVQVPPPAATAALWPHTLGALNMAGPFVLPQPMNQGDRMAGTGALETTVADVPTARREKPKPVDRAQDYTKPKEKTKKMGTASRQAASAPRQAPDVGIGQKRCLAFQTQTFPVKLFRLILDAEKNNNHRIIEFTPAGDAFLLHDRDALMKELVPKHLRLKSFASFRRQMCLYGFDKRVNGSSLEYKHELFHRDHPSKLIELVRLDSRRRKEAHGSPPANRKNPPVEYSP